MERLFLVSVGVLNGVWENYQSYFFIMCHLESVAFLLLISHDMRDHHYISEKKGTGMDKNPSLFLILF